MPSISLVPSQLSRNSSKILIITQHYIFDVLVFLLFGRCIYVLVAYHYKSYNGYYFKQQTNWVHLAKVEEVEVVMSLLNTPLGSRM